MKINTLQFTEVICSLLKSGLSLQNALNVAPDILNNKNDRLFCNMLSKGINDGKTLTEILSGYEKLFSPLYISFVNIGEKSGSLAEVFDKLVEYLKVKKENNGRLIQNLLYPLIVLITALAVVFVIVFFIFPRLQGIFDAFGDASVELSVRINKMYLNLKVTAIIFSLLSVFLVVITILYKYSFSVKKRIDAFIIKVPLIGKQIIFSESHDFSFSMKLLSSTYYPFSESLLLSSNVLSNEKYKSSVINAYNKIQIGDEVGKSFEEEKIFPSYLITWLKMAEIDGNLANCFTQIYEYFKIENRTFSSRLGAILEPLFILITGIIIIALISQFVLPIFKLMGAL